MIINNSNIVSVKKEMEMPAQKVQTQCSTDKNIPEQNTVDVSADTLRAYTGIENKTKKVSPKEVVEFLKNTGMKNENLYPEILKSLEDENGEITQLSFNFLKSFQAKNNPLFISSTIFNAAKEDGKINYAALKLADLILQPINKFSYFQRDYCTEALTGLKNKDGLFNKDALKFFIRHSDVYNKLFNFKPQSAFAPLKNNNGDFDLKALDYADKKLTEKEKLQKLIPQLYSARDKDGNFSYEIMELNDYLSQIFKEWQINYVQEIALSFPKDKKKERDTFIELAKSMKDEQDFSQIFNFIKNMKAGENANSALEFDKASVDFLREMENSGYQALDNLNKLMTMKLPMSSRDAFQNFLVYQDIDTIEKLEKIDFMELGLKTGQVSSGIFKSATQEELLRFKEYVKDYIKDKNIKSVDIQLNPNISSIVELTSGPDYDKKKLLYDIRKGEPTAEIYERKWNKNVTRKEKDFKNNTVTEFRNRIVLEDYTDYEILKSQILKKFDNNNNLLYEEEIKPSAIPNVFDITRTYSDGRIEKISNASKTKDGNEIIEKNMTSIDGTKTYYRYENDPKGNRILDYVITDKNGKKLLNQSVTFEVIDDNHFVSSRNNKKFDIKIQGDNLIVKDLKTKQTKTIELKSFTRDTQELVLPVLKMLPGDELFKMKEIDLKALYATEKIDNAAFSPREESIMMKPKYLDVAILLHEFGHAKDRLMFKEISEQINNDPKLKEIFDEEKKAYREHFGDSELSKIDYFTADYHYLGANSIHEGIAETNTILNTCPKNDIQSIRSHYWQQYFPRTIAYLAGLMK